MGDSGYTPPEGYMTMAEAQARLGVTRTTLRKRVIDRGLRVYTDPRDTRVRLLKAEDVERLTRPEPTDPREGKAAA